MVRLFLQITFSSKEFMMFYGMKRSLKWFVLFNWYNG